VVARAVTATSPEAVVVEYQSDFAKRYVEKGRAEGRAEGTARGVLAVLAARSVDVPAAFRELVLACTDLPTLDAWIARAVTATSVEGVVTE
jgi:hypothetical protein